MADLGDVVVPRSHAVPRAHTLTEMRSLIGDRADLVLASGLFAGVRQYTGGHRKADVVANAAEALQVAGVETMDDFVEAVATTTTIRSAWLSVDGLGKASWAYVCLLAGMPRSKPDRMIQSFVADAAGLDKIPLRTLESVFAAALEQRNGRDGRVPVSLAAADHTVWLKVSRRLP